MSFLRPPLPPPPSRPLSPLRDLLQPILPGPSWTSPRFFLVDSHSVPLSEDNQFVTLTDGIHWAPAIFNPIRIPEHELIEYNVVIGVRSFRIWPFWEDNRAGITLLDIYAVGVMDPFQLPPLPLGPSVPLVWDFEPNVGRFWPSY